MAAVMAMGIRRESHLPALMREWAEWYADAMHAGWSGETTLWRAMLGEGSSAPRSSEPTGVMRLRTYGALRRLVRAMDSLLADESCAEVVRFTQAFYLAGVDEIRAATGKSRAAVYNTVKIGEALIQREMNLRV